MPDEHGDIIQQLAAQWVRWAHADMTVAALVDDERIAPEIIAFHAQQAVEKMLKALLVRRQVDFPRTHSIGALLAFCAEAGFGGAQEFTDASSLTRYAVATRYPGEEEPVTRQEAKDAVTLAAQVFVWSFTQLREIDGTAP
jgi:HEPN domain-containing protein